MSTVHERVKTIIEHHNLTIYKFAARVGEERAEKFYNIIKGKMKPNFETMQSIGNGFPEINIDWLVMNRGEMLLSHIPTPNELSEKSEIVEEELIPPSPEFITRTQMLEQQLADREKMIEMLHAEVVFLRGLVANNKNASDGM